MAEQREAVTRWGEEWEPVIALLRWARASDPDGPGDRIGVTDSMSEGLIYIHKPPGFKPDGPPDKVRLVQRGWIPKTKVRIPNATTDLPSP